MTWSPKFTDEQWRLVQQVALLRIGIPDDKELARALGIPIRSIRYMARQTRVSSMTLETSVGIARIAETAATSADVHGPNRIHDPPR